MIGHPLVGETKFSLRREFSLRGKRAYLHAGYLEFPHPITQVPVQASAPLPRDMAAFLAKNPR
jgi:23S rRNA-/tRNA-specific pseudouridylate synthase